MTIHYPTYRHTERPILIGDQVRQVSTGRQGTVLSVGTSHVQVDTWDAAKNGQCWPSPRDIEFVAGAEDPWATIARLRRELDATVEEARRLAIALCEAQTDR